MICKTKQQALEAARDRAQWANDDYVAFSKGNGAYWMVMRSSVLLQAMPDKCFVVPPRGEVRVIDNTEPRTSR